MYSMSRSTYPAILQYIWLPISIKIKKKNWWKKGNNSKMGNQIYFKIAVYVYLAVLIIFIPCQISDIINGFWVITQKPAILSYVLFLVTVL
jgi:hypothetical protein